jgi:hypothetical protein
MVKVFCNEMAWQKKESHVVFTTLMLTSTFACQQKMIKSGGDSH